MNEAGNIKIYIKLKFVVLRTFKNPFETVHLKSNDLIMGILGTMITVIVFIEKNNSLITWKDTEMKTKYERKKASQY